METAQATCLAQPRFLPSCFLSLFRPPAVLARSQRPLSHPPHSLGWVQRQLRVSGDLVPHSSWGQLGHPQHPRG